MNLVSRRICSDRVNFLLTKKLLLAAQNPRLLPVAELSLFREEYRHWKEMGFEMAKTAAKTAPVFEGLTALMERHADALSSQLQAHHLKVFPPTSEKGIRTFAPSEAAKLLGVSFRTFRYRLEKLGLG